MEAKDTLSQRRDGALTDTMLYRVDDINKHCLEEFRKHWTCLEDNNQQLWQCRKPEWKLNKCVFDNLVGYIRSTKYNEKQANMCLRRNSRRSSQMPRESPFTCVPSKSMHTTLFSETLVRSHLASPLSHHQLNRHRLHRGRLPGRDALIDVCGIPDATSQRLYMYIEQEMPVVQDTFNSCVSPALRSFSSMISTAVVCWIQKQGHRRYQVSHRERQLDLACWPQWDGRWTQSNRELPT